MKTQVHLFFTIAALIASLILSACTGATKAPEATKAAEPTLAPAPAQPTTAPTASPVPVGAALTLAPTALPASTAVAPTQAPTLAPTVPSAPIQVQVTLTEFKIESTLTTFAEGKTYQFVVKNAGMTIHEFAILPAGEKDHEKALFEVDEHELPKGAAVTRNFVFTKTGNYVFACLLTGHYDAGMSLPIVVK